MRIPERYRLIFNWDVIRYEGSVALFNQAAFTGPVLSNATKIQPDDHIELDFTLQNMESEIFLPNTYYIARLSWKDAIYKPWGVELTECRLQHHKNGSLKELKDRMKFYIDCSTHEHTTHYKFLVYPAWVVNRFGEEIK